MVSMSCYAMVDESQRAERHDLGIYRNAINMCVVWYHVEKTGKMQDARCICKSVAAKKKGSKTPSLEKRNNREDS